MKKLSKHFNQVHQKEIKADLFARRKWTDKETMEEICIASDISSKVNDDIPTIASFLAGKNIFITGGTGFLGTVLIERLLSATDDIGNIYVLIRGKNGFSPELRIKRMMSKTVSIGVKQKTIKFLTWFVRANLRRFLFKWQLLSMIFANKKPVVSRFLNSSAVSWQS